MNRTCRLGGYHELRYRDSCEEDCEDNGCPKESAFKSPPCLVGSVAARSAEKTGGADFAFLNENEEDEGECNDDINDREHNFCVYWLVFFVSPVSALINHDMDDAHKKRGEEERQVPLDCKFWAHYVKNEEQSGVDDD